MKGFVFRYGAGRSEVVAPSLDEALQWLDSSRGKSAGLFVLDEQASNEFTKEVNKRTALYAQRAKIEAEKRAEEWRIWQEDLQRRKAEEAAQQARIQAWVDMRKEQEREAKYRKSKAYASRIRKACSSIDLSRELGRFVLPVDGFYTEANTSVIYG